MHRIEIIFNQSLEEEILDTLKKIPGAEYYTHIPNVRGKGSTNPKMGDSVWPEYNGLLFLYVKDTSTVEHIKNSIETIKKAYPQEGISIFCMHGI